MVKNCGTEYDNFSTGSHTNKVKIHQFHVRKRFLFPYLGKTTGHWEKGQAHWEKRQGTGKNDRALGKTTGHWGKQQGTWKNNRT